MCLVSEPGVRLCAANMQMNQRVAQLVRIFDTGRTRQAPAEEQLHLPRVSKFLTGSFTPISLGEGVPGSFVFCLHHIALNP